MNKTKNIFKLYFFLLFFPFVLLAQLNQGDKKAISDYSGHRFKFLNQALREGKPIPQSEMVFYRELKTALGKIPPYKGIAFRGAYLNPNALNAIKKRQMVSDEAFNSATLDEKLGRCYSFDGNALLEIESATSRPIIEFSNFPEEKEVIFLPFTVYKSDYKGKIRVKNPLFCNSPDGDTKEVDHIKLQEINSWPSAPVTSLSNGKILRKP